MATRATITINDYDYFIYQLKANTYVVNTLAGTFSSQQQAIEALRLYVSNYGQRRKRARQ